MKNDIFNKVVLSGILLCLIIIAFNISSNESLPIEAPNVDIDNRNLGGKVVQLSPNLIGVVDEGNRTGWEQLIVFEYNSETKTFEFVSSLPYEDILNHPEVNHIPTREGKYGNNK